MNFKKNVLCLAKKNTYLANSIYSVYKFKLEKQIEELSRSMSQYDTINDINCLVNLKNDIKLKQKPFFSYNLNRTSSRLYGISPSIFKFINDKNIYFPSAEHGLILHNKNWSDTASTLRASCVTFGQFRKSILQEHYKTPIFCIGPYTHYATDYYSEEDFLRKKSVLGKNLLVFPTHGTDDCKITYSQQNFVDKILEIKNNFDSVSVCVFWWNIDDPLVKILKNIGCHIVSAGFREDRNFLSRLKTIIKLSDFIIGDSIGTHVGYCLHLGKPFSYFSTNTEISTDNLGDSENQIFINYHSNILKKTFLNSKEITDEQIEIANHYWGFDQIKSPNEIHDIYTINKLITKKCMGFVDRYSDYARYLLENKTNVLTEKQCHLLKNSLE